MSRLDNFDEILDSHNGKLSVWEEIRASLDNDKLDSLDDKSRSFVTDIYESAVKLTDAKKDQKYIIWAKESIRNLLDVHDCSNAHAVNVWYGMTKMWLEERI